MFTVRLAQISDLESLIQLEKSCWESHLNATEEVITNRILRYPAGNKLMHIIIRFY